jgi:sugar phosphate isomerase/epimerase
MKQYYLIVAVVLFLSSSCSPARDEYNIALEDLYAWCIVPFDRLERSPAERIRMLQQLSITKYAYDWREEHLPSMAEELMLAKKNAIEVIAVWMWIDDSSDSSERLSEPNERVFEIIEEVGYRGQIWVGFSANFFEELTDSSAVAKGAKMIGTLSDRADTLGCKVALYNHGDWFGEPENQIKIIRALPGHDLGIVYNFHHAHHQIEAFPQWVSAMLPYLWHVNLNGLRKEGPKILTVGEGHHEKDMVTLLLKEGYTGGFGILGHVEDADVKTILEANLKGLKELMQ